MNKFIALFIILISACGDNPTPQKQEYSQKEQLSQKYEQYLIDTDTPYHDCDSLLFSSILAVGGVDLYIEDYQDQSTGQWFRRPSKDCYIKGEAQSTITRDMLLGLYWYMWEFKRLDLALDLWDYAQKNNYKMGDGDWQRVYLTPIMLDTLALIINNLGGSVQYKTVEIWSDFVTGYQQYLVALHVLLRAEITGSISYTGLKCIQKFNEQNAQDVLFQYIVSKYADGNQDKTVQLLLSYVGYPYKKEVIHANMYFLFVAKKLLEE